jgi:ABC-type dipeptide/oligopeptide/nickel transport system ATPase component
MAGNVKAIDNVSLDLKEGSFVTLLGLSGAEETDTEIHCRAGRADRWEKIYINDNLFSQRKMKCCENL